MPWKTCCSCRRKASIRPRAWTVPWCAWCRTPPPAQVDVARLSEMVQVAFSQRRKLLRHTLGRWLDAQGLSGRFDVQRRAEEVPVAEYVALALATPA
jgi:16S rRNA A1518/A1519 N6-dimethyltransferase RsmA/KsgA/DIM1 with predicted DNA glycosylase/AP lyase activity